MTVKRVSFKLNLLVYGTLFPAEIFSCQIISLYFVNYRETNKNHLKLQSMKRHLEY